MRHAQYVLMGENGTEERMQKDGDYRLITCVLNMRRKGSTESLNTENKKHSLGFTIENE